MPQAQAGKSFPGLRVLASTLLARVGDGLLDRYAKRVVEVRDLEIEHERHDRSTLAGRRLRALMVRPFHVKRMEVGARMAP